MRIHFKRIFIQSLQHVPRKGAAILACNHPNSFLDAIVVALTLKRDIHFLVRSDVFRKPLAAAILKRLNMIPIYRLEEGAENLERNKGTFDLCNSILDKGGIILIFSEGNCVVEKRLRSLRKGTARIWLGAMEQRGWTNPIPVIPVGINYTHPYYCRSEVRYPILKAWYSEPFRFAKEKQSLERLFAHQSSEKIVHDAENTGKAIRKMGIPIEYFGKRVPSWQTVFLMLGFLPAIFSLILHAITLWLTQRAVRKTKFHPKFRSSVMFGMAALSSYLMYLLLTLALLLIDTKFILLLPFLPRLTYLSVLWWDQLQLRRARIQVEMWRRQAPEIAETIIHNREILLLQSGFTKLHRKT